MQLFEKRIYAPNNTERRLIRDSIQFEGTPHSRAEIKGIEMATKTATKHQYSQSVQTMREELAELPKLEQERDELRAEIERRTQRICEGELPREALDEPNARLRHVRHAINDRYNQHPQKIMQGLSGELKEQLRELLDRKQQAGIAHRDAMKPVTSAEEQLANRRLKFDEANRRLEKRAAVSSKNVSKAERDQHDRYWNQEIRIYERYVKNARERAEGPEKKYQEAVQAYQEFKNEHVWGLCGDPK